MAQRHDKRGAPEIPGCPLFLQLGVGGAAVCPSAAPAAGDHVVQRLVESLLVSQLLEREVHPVTPVVSGDGRDVDAFLGRVGGAQGRVGREPVLQRKYGEHGRGAEVHVDDAAVDPRFAFCLRVVCFESGRGASEEST